MPCARSVVRQTFDNNLRVSISLTGLEFIFLELCEYLEQANILLTNKKCVVAKSPTHGPTTLKYLLVKLLTQASGYTYYLRSISG